MRARPLTMDRFDVMLAPGNPSFDLAEAALIVASDAYPKLDVAGELEHIRSMGQRLNGRLPADLPATRRLLALNHYLFNELGFRGNKADYYDARNSYLNDVLVRRTGIPITLAILYIDIGSAIGLNLVGMSFPGHFLVRMNLRNGVIILDPFSNGVALSEADLRQRLEQHLGGVRAPLLAPFLAAASPQQILARLLGNLQRLFQQNGEHEHLLKVLNRLLVLHPEQASLWSQRAQTYRSLECFRASADDFERCLRLLTDEDQVASVAQALAEVRAKETRLN